jgi:hypothetical protein
VENNPTNICIFPTNIRIFALWYYADSFLRILIWMFEDVRWVGFHPPILAVGGNNPINSCIFPTNIHIFASWYYAGSFLQMLIRMFAVVRWVGFLPPILAVGGKQPF